ncbi:hypothetical protein [Mesoplasma lactucae]|uniref:Uncharacterized protein n=1 Tax=Mesoplasma lactucae ATCC 49193 TaxID=81460 RepID=A0A291IQG6_9MOLU|nr:hypothetical protein [Mesoplasma lactucae]ATG97165.1 hypothetical protein CP520_00085 [Mesoplasma lactucae ATCC 49193]ATZ20395.1 hypothetical protein MLACT_v1c05740 [Mesoplasma lactucae ATCC 49193]MCL8216566.1 hypothetical protein [Mesoplasma lactucae ATCC 49193]
MKNFYDKYENLLTPDNYELWRLKEDVNRINATIKDADLILSNDEGSKFPNFKKIEKQIYKLEKSINSLSDKKESLVKKIKIKRNIKQINKIKSKIGLETSTPTKIKPVKNAFLILGNPGCGKTYYIENDFSTKINKKNAFLFNCFQMQNNFRDELFSQFMNYSYLFKKGIYKRLPNFFYKIFNFFSISVLANFSSDSRSDNFCRRKQLRIKMIFLIVDSYFLPIYSNLYSYMDCSLI